jgi:hypothetical protein
MATFDETQKLSFGGWRIPYSKFSIELKTQSHLHKYPHTPGAALEKMGRDLYVFQVSGEFDDCLTPEILFVNWTEVLAGLRELAEDESTEDAVIPLIGKIRAKIENLKIDVSAKRTSGPEAISFTLLEDMSDKFLASQLFTPNTSALATAHRNFAESFPDGVFTQSLFSQINDAVSSVMALKDQALLYGSLLESKILYAIGLIKYADATLDELQNLDKLPLFQTIMELWESLADLINNRLLNESELRKYTVVRESTLQEVAIAISNLVGHEVESGDLLGLNRIEDPFTIRAGTRINYYP